MARSNLKLAASRPPKPTLAELEAALEEADKRHMAARIELQKMPVIPYQTPFDDPSRQAWDKAFANVCRLEEEVAATLVAIDEHRASARLKVSEADRRAALAAAQTKRTRARQQFDQTNAALARAGDRAERAGSALTEASAAVRDARAQLSEEARRAATTDAEEGAASSALQAARDRERTAADQLEAANDAVAAVAAERDAAAQEVDAAEREVAGAVDYVIEFATAGRLARAETLRQQFSDALAVLDVLSPLAGAEQQQKIRRWNNQPIGAADVGVVEPWRRLRAELDTNADAKFPAA